jgi:hypothetical protein
MSFAYKPISPSQINISFNEVNKSYQYDTLLDDNISLFVGENIPSSFIDPIQLNEYNRVRLKQFNTFDAINDDKTQNDEYKRLIFSSIKHLFYEGFIQNNGIFNSTSSYEHYPQTTLYSGSFSTTFRNISNVTGSSIASIESGYNSFPIYDNIFLYDQTGYQDFRGGLIYIISIHKEIYGNGLKENEVIYNYSGSYIRDDGYGNLFDYVDEDGYNTYKLTQEVTGTLVGNVIYNMGLLIITNSAYLCIFDVPPVAVNNTYTFNNLQVPNLLDIYANDYSDCNDINYELSVLVSQSGFSFPTSFLDADYLYLVEDQNLYIPGTYKIGYKIFNNNSIESNVGIVTLNITSNPLSIKIENDQTCSGSLIELDYLVTIGGGVPIYSYSYDNINYQTLVDFQTNEITAQILTNTSSIYVKDYIGNVVSGTFDWFFENEYDITIESASFCTNTGSITLNTTESIIFNIENVGGPYNPNTRIAVPVGSYNVFIETPQSCSITESITIPVSDNITYSANSSSVSCFGNSDGTFNILSISGGNIPYEVNFNSITRNNITTESISYNNLPTGSYVLEITDNDNCVFTSSIDILGPTEVTASITTEYLTPCYPTLNITGSGGNDPYIYTIISTNNIYVSTDSLIPLTSEGLEETYVTCSIEDVDGCSNIFYHYIPGRIWEYSGSFCEQI